MDDIYNIQLGGDKDPRITEVLKRLTAIEVVLKTFASPQEQKHRAHEIKKEVETLDEIGNKLKKFAE